ncbi:uncharacterized protein LOC130613612 [Hydractinia symbiolongicarpus]|uniref:uncharacterized protein LOC130613612 n=1 Tax=Hydractinia symbiolongicarpus TaxID=13093 RepID=UPI00254C2F81|nr:uncharacterized protein LOC130613612 [Hydractinia symbiolongicarpus]
MATAVRLDTNEDLQDVTEVDSLRKLLCTDDGLDVLSKIGYHGVSQCSNMESKNAVLRAILMKDKMPMTSVLDQICERLRAYGLLDVIKKTRKCSKMSLVTAVSCDSQGDACAVLKFVSGVGTIPPLGLSSNLIITFKHWCVNLPKLCHCKSTVSTCSLNLTLPVHYNTFESMKTAVEDSV